MSCSLGLLLQIQTPNALPSQTRTPLCLTSKHKPTLHTKFNKEYLRIGLNSIHFSDAKKCRLAIQVGALLAVFDQQSALAVTGVNHEQDLFTVLIQLGIVAFGYFIIMPPIIMNWLRIRWYRRNLLEMYLQFMFVFMFFPGVLLWAPFLNFRKFPRDPSMKYPWDTPKDPSQIKNAYLKYPFAEPEDYS